MSKYPMNKDMYSIEGIGVGAKIPQYVDVAFCQRIHLADIENLSVL